MDLKNMSQDEKEALAEDINTPVDVLRNLATNTQWAIRGSVAENPSTPEDLLRKLAKDKKSWVRGRVAKNTSAPEDVLMHLTDDYYHWDIRESLAKNSKSSIKILLKLFDQEKHSNDVGFNPDMITTLYKNPKLPYVAKVVIETLYGEWL